MYIYLFHISIYRYFNVIVEAWLFNERCWWSAWIYTISGKFKGVLVQGVPEYTTKSKKEDKRQEKKPPAVEEKKSREVPEMEKPQADKAPERCKSPPPTAKVNEKIQEDVKEIPEKVKENMVPAAPVQTHKPHVPEYNVIRMLEKGKTMRWVVCSSLRQALTSLRCLGVRHFTMDHWFLGLIPANIFDAILHVIFLSYSCPNDWLLQISLMNELPEILSFTFYIML